MDTIKPVEITCDPVKNEANVRERGLPFSLVKDEFDWSTALSGRDLRRDYGEQRQVAIGYVGQRLHVVVYTRTGASVRVISFRKANVREVKRYAQATRPRID